MWYLAILVAFGVSTVNGQAVANFDCRPLLFPMNQFIGARTAFTATASRADICACFINNDNFVRTDRYVVEANNNDGRTVVYEGTISELCNSTRLNEGLRFRFLRGSTDYRLRALIYRDGVLIASTAETDVFSLRTPQDYHTINTNNTHSAGMIVITSILPTLFALLLAMFSSMLLMSCCCCQVFTPTKCQQDT